MGKRRFLLAGVLVSGLCALTGCSRQDTECLSNIGRKLRDRAGTLTASYRQKLDGLKQSKVSADSVTDRVRLRLRWEKVLADVSIDVVANGRDIELQGTVKTAEQRNRAVEVAESTVGVERVLVSLTVGE